MVGVEVGVEVVVGVVVGVEVVVGVGVEVGVGVGVEVEVVTSPISRSRSRTAWTQEKGDKYEVTGVLRNGRRFKKISFARYDWAEAINLWRGSRWLVRGGKRYLIERVVN